MQAEQAALLASEVLYAHDILLNARCGGQGVCDGCELELLAGTVVDIDTDGRLTGGAETPRFRACRSRFLPSRELAVRIPSRSLAAYEPLATADFSIRVPYGHRPLFDGKLAAVVDVGTTSVTVAVVDLDDGRILTARSARNAQSRCGIDVLSRIARCQQEQQAIGTLQRAICRETIRPLLDQCLHDVENQYAELAGITIAANTVMLHLLAGVDPTPLGHAPFEPVFRNHRVLEAGEMGLAGDGLPGDRPVHLLPSASAYIGADVVAGAVATGLAFRQHPCLLLDLGTNGEVLLKHGNHTLGCATAAGPAFEGASLTCGMTASRGAISRVRLNDSPPGVTTDVEGDEQPRGICGSAYVDLIAEGRRTGLIDQLGRLQFGEAPAFAPWKDRFDGETALRIAVDPDRRPIVLTEGDIASLLQAKAAIAAGTITLLERCRLAASEVSEALIAGAFGAHLDTEHAVDIGLLPAGLRGRCEAVGNTSLAGAYLLAMDRQVLEDLTHFADAIDVVELNSDEQFESRFIDHLSLP